MGRDWLAFSDEVGVVAKAHPSLYAYTHTYLHIYVYIRIYAYKYSKYAGDWSWEDFLRGINISLLLRNRSRSPAAQAVLSH